MSGQQAGIIDRLTEVPSPYDLPDWSEKDGYYVATCRASKGDVPSLIDVALKWADPEWSPDDDLPGVDSSRAQLLPVTAWRTLADLRAEEAAEPLVDLLRAVQGETDEWVMDELPFVFGKIGESAVEPLAEFAREQDSDPETRSTAVDALAEIAKAHPAVRDRVVEILTEIMTAREDHVELNSHALLGLVDLDGSEAAEAIERAFSENRIDVGMIGDWNDVRRELGVEGLGLSMPEHPVNSIEAFHQRVGLGIFSDRRIFFEVDVDDDAAGDYCGRAAKAFSESPEAEQICRRYGEIGWYRILLEFGLNYVGEIVDAMSLGSVREFVFDYVPRKVSADPESAPEIIDELTMFWQFIDRVYDLPQAKEIVEWLSADRRSEELEAELADDRNFGMAKSMVMLGQEAGFDMTTQEGLDEFLLAYNAQMLLDRHGATAPPPAASPPPAVSDSAAPPSNRRARRNGPCPCGSGKKYKKCCGRR